MSTQLPNNRDYRTSLKTINFSYFNANRSADAIKEMIVTRPRDNIFLVSEVALADKVPVNIPGYYSIYDDSPTQKIRTCAYLKESITDCLESFTTSPDHVTIKLIDGWSIVACYIDQTSDIPSSILTPLTDRSIVMDDFNAKHQQWFDLGPNTDRHCITRGQQLANWSKRYNLVERGPREATRHQDGFRPSKLDLIWTTRHRTNFTCLGYFPNSRSDHHIISARLRLIRPPKAVNQPRPNYKKMNSETLIEFFKSKPAPTTPSALDTYLKESMLLIPQSSKPPVHRLPEYLISMRRSLRHVMKKRWGSDEYITLRHQYRDALTNHINGDIENSLDSSQNPDCFKFSKRGTPAKPVPSLKYNNQIYTGHARIARCLAENHGAGPKVNLPCHPQPNIPEVTPTEVSDCLAKAPTSSTNGPDSISAELLKILHSVHPTCLSSIYTNILRAGRHPPSWKKATIVPIPKANKPTYTVPKSWRSIHLLNVVSKTLERIVLSRLQSSQPGLPDPLGPSQFGSRINRGTSDAMQALLRWKDNAHAHGHYVTLVAADIEGGFDKVHPDRLSSTDIDPTYIPWIQNWATNREIRFRLNNRTDLKSYITNRGVPQGSPLSPLLFGAYIKSVMKPRLSSNPDSTSIVLSYVDDVLICVSASTPQETERITRNLWADVTREAQTIGMSFAENKTKTWHDRTENWGIGTTTPKLRYLGYWLETPLSSHRTEPPSYNHHLAHWTVKANHMFNILRALSMRSTKGLRTPAILQIFESCCRSMLHYGIEFWGHIPELLNKADSFTYAAMRILFDLPNATPHRAISSEFRLVPSKYRYNLIVRRLATRQLMHRPLAFLDGLVPPGELHNKITTSIDLIYQNLPPAPKNFFVNWSLNLQNVDFSTSLNFLNLANDDLLVFSDGSYKDCIASYGVVIFSGASWLEDFPLYENHERLTPQKSILDAEIYGILEGLRAALLLPEIGRIYLLSDSQSALKMFLPICTIGTHPYIQEISSLVSSTDRQILPTWVRGHAGNKGNTRADLLAKTATSVIRHDHAPGPSYSYLNLHIRTLLLTEWKEWFQSKPHQYTREPTISRGHHKGHTRLDSIALFKLRANKGWHPTDHIGTQTPPPCTCDPTSTRDALHVAVCPIYSRARPLNISDWTQQDSRTPEVMKWIRQCHHFGMVPKTSTVRWIRLSLPGDLLRSRSHKCTICTQTFSTPSSLTRHIGRKHPDPNNPSHTPARPVRSISCQECTDLFTSLTTMETHYASTHGCSECHNLFTTGPNLTHHQIRYHGGLQCAGCSLRFDGKIALRQHQRSNCGGSRS